MLPGPLLWRRLLAGQCTGVRRDEAVPNRHRDHRGDPALRDNPPQLHQVRRGKNIVVNIHPSLAWNSNISELVRSDRIFSVNFCGWVSK